MPTPPKPLDAATRDNYLEIVEFIAGKDASGNPVASQTKFIDGSLYSDLKMAIADPSVTTTVDQAKIRMQEAMQKVVNTMQNNNDLQNAVERRFGKTVVTNLLGGTPLPDIRKGGLADEATGNTGNLLDDGIEHLPEIGLTIAGIAGVTSRTLMGAAWGTGALLMAMKVYKGGSFTEAALDMNPFSDTGNAPPIHKHGAPGSLPVVVDYKGAIPPTDVNRIRPINDKDGVALVS